MRARPALGLLSAKLERLDGCGGSGLGAAGEVADLTLGIGSVARGGGGRRGGAHDGDARGYGHAGREGHARGERDGDGRGGGDRGGEGGKDGGLHLDGWVGLLKAGGG